MAFPSESLWRRPQKNRLTALVGRIQADVAGHSGSDAESRRDACVRAAGGADPRVPRRVRNTSPLEPSTELGPPSSRPAGPLPAEVNVAEKADAFLAPLDPGSAKDLKQLLMLFDNALFSVVMGGPPRPFTQMSPDEQDRHLRSWATSRLAIRRTGFQALKRLAAAIYFGSPETYASVGYPGPPYELVRSVNAARSR